MKIVFGSYYKGESINEIILESCGLFIDGVKVGGVDIKNEPRKTVFLSNLEIEEEYRGKKYGNILLNEIEKLITKLGYKRITLTVDSANFVAINMYKKFGFKISSKEEDTSSDSCQICNMSKAYTVS